MAIFIAKTIRNMKNYFDFTLTGKKLLPVWLVLIFLIIIPFIYLFVKLLEISFSHFPFIIEGWEVDVKSFPFLRFGLMYVGLVIGIMLSYYFLIKYSIEGLKYQEQQPVFGGGFGSFMARVILGFFLCIITLGIYSPWYIKNLTQFFVNRSSYKQTNFVFLGEGGPLFAYLIVALILPAIALGVIVALLSINTDQDFIHRFIYKLSTYIITIPFMYLYYKWFVNLLYKDYHISWKTELMPACAKILGQVLLMFVTVGIYAPLAYLKIYQYFVGKTVAESPKKTMYFGYELEAADDFLFIWGQWLLTLITLGIYFPWAFSKIGKRVLSKTYSEVVEA